MKKALMLLLAAMLLVSFSPAALAGDVIELELLYHKSETAAIEGMQAVIDMYNESNPNVRVVLNQVPDSSVVLQTRAQTNEMPDMFGCTTSNTYELMFDDGLILDLSGQDFLANVQESTLELSTYDGKYWRMPYSLSAYGLYVRTDIFEEQGLELPATWDELMDVCEKLVAAGITPFTLPDKTMVYQRMERMMSFLADDDSEFQAIAAGEMTAEESSVLSEYAQASLQLSGYMTKESLGAEYTESYQQLLAGEAAMTINGQWSLTTLKDYDPDVQVVLIPLPNPNGDESKVVVSIDTSFCISTSTEHPQECLDFLAFLAQPEIAQAYTDLEGSPNVIKGVTLNVPELELINETMNNGQVCISQNAIWPSGFRKELGTAATDLVVDGDVEAFYDEATLIIEEYYNN